MPECPAHNTKKNSAAKIISLSGSCLFHSFRKHHLFISLVLLAIPLYINAAEDSEQQTGIQVAANPATDTSPIGCEPSDPAPQIIPPKDDKIHLQSDSADMSDKKVTTFSGSVVIQQKNQHLTADKAVYHKEQNKITATGNIRLSQDSLDITADSLKMNLKTSEGNIKNATYHDKKTKAQGKAESIVIKNKTRLQMSDATYTTCNVNSPDWLLSATSIKLDNETHQGSANNVVIRFKNIPFLYLPYLRFPIGNERLSGFLFPSFGSSVKNGSELYVPYYWNIHPQFDATITPHYMSRRGTQLLSEFRYLTENSQGTFNIDYLPNDSIALKDREAFRWKHKHNPDGGWAGDLVFNYVSDEVYLDDFGGDLDSASQSNLERRADIRYDAEDWLFRARFQGFQKLSSDEQVKRLPQLNFNTRQAIEKNTLNTSFQSEWTRFAHSTQAPIGDRLVLQPSVSLPLSNAAAYTTFLASLHHTRYELDRTSSNEDKTPTRTVPILSIDSGVFFERDSELAGSDYLHTLEPRLQYLYIPYREQSSLPTFDTATLSSDINQLFSENRYSGADRINDANQITFGLTSRYIDLNSGAEVLTATLGQTYHFESSRVNLSGEQATQDSWSDLQLDVTFQPSQRLKVNGTLIRNQQSRKIDQRNVRLQYKSDRNHIFNINYRFQRDTLETREISGIWQLHPQWVVLARKHDDLRQDRELETVYGIQYDSCCWSLRLVKRRYYTDAYPSDPYQEALFVELELKGLSSFGQKNQIDSLLNRGILGYSQ